MEHVRPILQLLEAVKTNNFFPYAGSIYEMTQLFFSIDGQNYACYLSYFSVFLANIDTSHPGDKDLIERGAISVARSFIPGSRCDVDKTIEETFMRHANPMAELVPVGSEHRVSPTMKLTKDGQGQHMRVFSS